MDSKLEYLHVVYQVTILWMILAQSKNNQTKLDQNLYFDAQS
jgi:hypothetical protein